MKKSEIKGQYCRIHFYEIFRLNKSATSSLVLPGPGAGGRVGSDCLVNVDFPVGAMITFWNWIVGRVAYHPACPKYNKISHFQVNAMLCVFYHN